MEIIYNFETASALYRAVSLKLHDAQVRLARAIWMKDSHHTLESFQAPALPKHREFTSVAQIVDALNRVIVSYASVVEDCERHIPLEVSPNQNHLLNQMSKAMGLSGA